MRWKKKSDTISNLIQHLLIPLFLQEKPRWEMVDVKYVRPIQRYIPLDELKKIYLEHKTKGGPLANLALFTRARLSVQPLTQQEWDFILTLAEQES
jgi:predicted RNA-binding protein with PUA-like domain